MLKMAMQWAQVRIGLILLCLRLGLGAEMIVTLHVCKAGIGNFFGKKVNYFQFFHLMASLSTNYVFRIKNFNSVCG